jgi:formylglycine-generating enzyme required for sulfatase activity
MRPVDLPAFLVARTETTWGDYLAFLRALPEAERKTHQPRTLSMDPTGSATLEVGDARLAEGQAFCSAQGPCVEWTRLPVGLVNRDDGEAYATWLARSARVPGARLCTDREWERAARGADDRRYPWGDAEPGPDDACSLTTYAGDVHRASLCEPTTHPASRSPFGADDMTGNVWEWTAGTPDVAQPSMAIVRGGGYIDWGEFLALCNRGLISHKFHGNTYGFRVCADAR